MSTVKSSMVKTVNMSMVKIGSETYGNDKNCECDTTSQDDKCYIQRVQISSPQLLAKVYLKYLYVTYVNMSSMSKNYCPTKSRNDKCQTSIKEKLSMCYKQQCSKCRCDTIVYGQNCQWSMLNTRNMCVTHTSM